MAEQITHKKISRLNSKSNREKRQLLKEYYRLNKEQQDKERLTEEQNQEAKHEQTDGHGREGAAEENKPINESTLAELLHTHNKLLGKETEANSTIKNTIYENYYDLIKVNDLLKQVATEKDDTLRELKKTLDMLKDV